MGLEKITCHFQPAWRGCQISTLIDVSIMANRVEHVGAYPGGRTSNESVDGPDGQLFSCRIYEPPFSYAGRVFNAKYVKFQAENRGDVLVVDEASFRHSCFKGDVKFCDITFTKSVDFTETTFGMRATFENVTFEQGAEFKGAKFYGHLHFDYRCKFNGRVDLDSVTFGERSSVSGDPDMSKVIGLERAKQLGSGRFENMSFRPLPFDNYECFYDPRIFEFGGSITNPVLSTLRIICDGLQRCKLQRESGGEEQDEVVEDDHRLIVHFRKLFEKELLHEYERRKGHCVKNVAKTWTAGALSAASKRSQRLLETRRKTGFTKMTDAQDTAEKVKRISDEVLEERKKESKEQPVEVFCEGIEGLEERGYLPERPSAPKSTGWSCCLSKSGRASGWKVWFDYAEKEKKTRWMRVNRMKDAFESPWTYILMLIGFQGMYLKRANLIAQRAQVREIIRLLEKLRDTQVTASNFKEHILDWDELRHIEASLRRLGPEICTKGPGLKNEVSANSVALIIIEMILHPHRDYERVGHHGDLRMRYYPHLESRVWGTPMSGIAAATFLDKWFRSYDPPHGMLGAIKSIGRRLRNAGFPAMMVRLRRERELIEQLLELDVRASTVWSNLILSIFIGVATLLSNLAFTWIVDDM